MKEWLRLLGGIALVFGVLVLAAELVPGAPVVSAFVEARPWLMRSDVTQLVFLSASLILMFILSKGNVSSYGLRGTSLRQLGRCLAVGSCAAVVVGFLAMVVGSMGGPPGGEGVGGPSEWGFLKLVISVWVVASTSEEMLFRGLIQSFLAPLKHHGVRLLGRRLSLPVTVAAVGLGRSHLGLLRRMASPMVALIVVSATVVGFIAGYYREKTGSIVPAIAVHMIFNIIGGGIPMILMTVMSRQGAAGP